MRPIVAALHRTGLLLLFAAVALVVAACGAATRPATQAPPTVAPTPRPTTVAPARPASTPTARAPAARPTLAPPAGMRTVSASQLPREARETLDLIERGGPFPYRQDGQTFQNREGLLPNKAEGYYREYTVETPDSADRGARRIVTGRDGEVYYTSDHYDSFRWVTFP